MGTPGDQTEYPTDKLDMEYPYNLSSIQFDLLVYYHTMCYECKLFIVCTAIGNLGHCLKQDCDIITI